MRPLIACCLLLFLTGRCIAGVFDPLRALAPAERISRTQEIYNSSIRKADSVYAIGELERLISLANELRDKPLQCFSVSLLADQYARYRGANALSEKLHREAIALSEEYGLPVMTGICNYRLGRYFYTFKQYPVAFEYLLRADNTLHELRYRNVPEVDEILFFIGSIYYETGNYEKAEQFLQNLQRLPRISGYIQKQSLNTLALIRKQQNDTAQALLYFHRTLEAAIAQHDSTWMGICYGNIGWLYFSSGNYARAYPLLQAAARLSRIYEQWGDEYVNLLSLAQIDLAANDRALAKKHIDSAVALHGKYFTIQGRKHLYEALAQYYEKEGKEAEAFAMQKQLMLVKDSLVASKDQQGYKKIQLQLETEKHLNDIDRLAAEASASGTKRNGIIILLILVVIVLLLLYNRYRLKAKNNAEQLKNAQKLLLNFTQNSRRKNEIIEQFSVELERLKATLSDQPGHRERMQHFDQLIHSTILTDAEWNDFRELFDKVHKGFFARLEQKLPGLSVNDTRLLALLKLGLGNADMANMMGIHPEAVQESRHRLRDKIHPSKDGLSIEDLVHAI